jgi:phosphopantothenoylcysteine decarboxylase/phosphopantothenate--cysteine ligase
VHFITPLTLSVLSGRPVYTEMFDAEHFSEDIYLYQSLQMFILIAPATANVIGKIASGVSDDLLTSTVCAFKGLLYCSRKDENMWLNPIT